MKTIYVQNNTGYKSTIEVFSDVVANSKNPEGGIRKKVLSKTFGVFTKDATTGKVLDTGFTAVAEDEYKKLLKGNKIFANQVSRGKYFIFEEPPKEALLDDQVIGSLQDENAELKSKVLEQEKLINQLISGAKTKEKKE